MFVYLAQPGSRESSGGWFKLERLLQVVTVLNWFKLGIAACGKTAAGVVIGVDLRVMCDSRAFVMEAES